MDGSSDLSFCSKWNVKFNFENVSICKLYMKRYIYFIFYFTIYYHQEVFVRIIISISNAIIYAYYRTNIDTALMPIEST